MQHPSSIWRQTWVTVEFENNSLSGWVWGNKGVLLHLTSIFVAFWLLVALPHLQVVRLLVMLWRPVGPSENSYFGSQSGLDKNRRTIDHTENTQKSLLTTANIASVWKNQGRNLAACYHKLWAQSSYRSGGELFSRCFFVLVGFLWSVRLLWKCINREVFSCL